jgi:hypothetical protein
MVFNQIASWPLTSNGIPTNVASNVNAGIFKGGTGLNTITFSSNGAYCSGWTTSTNVDTADYYQISISPASGYKLVINKIAFQERRSLSGIRNYEVRISKTLNFSTYYTIASVTVPDNDSVRDGTISGLNILVNNGETLYIRWYGYNAESSSGTWRINANSLAVWGNVSEINPNDNDTYASEPQTQYPADTISSLRTSVNLAKPIFSFNINDVGTSDNLPTKVSFISIKNYLNTDWVQTIAGAFLKVNNNTISASNVSVNQNTINFQFNEGQLVIPNNSSIKVDLYIYLKTYPLTDQSKIQCYVDSTSFDSYITGSGFSNTFQSIVSNVFTIEVTASKVLITEEPSLVIPFIPFKISANVVDANNNVDLTYNGNLRIDLFLGSSQLQSASGLVKPVFNGQAQWNDIIYQQNEIIQLLVVDDNTTLQPAYTNYIYCITPPSTLFDDFSDGNFNQNPTWIGNTGDFIVNTSYQLELNTVISSSPSFAYLSTPVKLTNDSTEWQAWINLKITPSGNNQVKYYLLSNNSDLTKPLKGYYILIGEDGSNDAIKFYYQDSLNSTLLSTATLGAIANNPQVRIKIIRNNSGLWRIYADYTGGSAFLLENVLQNNDFYDTIAFTGVLCKFTTSYSKSKYFFDDFYVGPVQVDTISPSLVDVIVVDSLHLDVLFSEAMDLTTTQDVNNYVVNNNIGVPVSAVRDPLNAALIHLTFNNPFISGVTYTLAFFNLTDLSNNLIPQPLATNFMWYYPKMFDVVINEIMADPTPSVQLPEYEYLELYNKSQYDLELKDWKLSINNTTIILPSFKLQANHYVILCHNSAVNALQVYGSCIPVLPSTSILTNSGAAIKLSYKDDKLIHFVEYSDKWYGSTYKDDGGWSLEQIDPNNPCGAENNWIASNDPKGGTPGAVNSVFRNNPDNTKPDLMRALILNNDSLLVIFNESVIDTSLKTTNFVVDKGIGSPYAITYASFNKQKIILIFNSVQFMPDTIYTLTVSAGISDCVGNVTNTNLTTKFGIGSPIEPGNIVINEVLYYEPTGGNDYVELYNKTNKIYNLKDLKLISYSSNDSISNILNITDEGFYLYPYDYVVITRSLKGVTNFYYTPYPKKILEMAKFPTLTSTGDRLTFVNTSLQTIDDFTFSNDMHFQLLNSFKGVALERINPDLPTQDKKSWHSAAQSVGFGTPTYKNSQYTDLIQINGEIRVEPEVFSPDMDGKDDNLYIYYKFPEPGYVANVSIFDAKGRLVRKLVKNELCGLEGYFLWDGLTDSKTKAEIGIHIIYVEIFNLQGKSNYYKKTCVVGGYLR